MRFVMRCDQQFDRPIKASCIRDVDHCWARLERQKAVKVVDRLLNAVYRIELLAAIDQCERTVSQALSYLTVSATHFDYEVALFLSGI